MIVVINSLGGLVSIQDEDLFQGSTKLNKIDLVAPFADNVIWKANFEMPDGTIRPENLDGYLLTPSMKVIDKLNVWKLDVTFPITQDYGIVTMQLRGYIGDTIVCTTSIKLPIQKGVPYDSDYTEITDKEQLLKLIEDIRALTNTKVDKVNYNYKLAENITADSVGIYYVYDYDTETYKNVTLPQGYIPGTEYYELLNTSRVTNANDGLFLEYVDNSNNQSVKLKVTADNVTINDKQVVVFDDLKAENITFDGAVSGLKSDNVKEAIEEVNRNVIDLENSVIKIDTNKLLNYYLKSETYTKDEVNNIVSKINSFKREVVNVLPTENVDENTIYLVSVEKAEGNNYYEEYLYINGRWELIGTTQVDLSDYVKKTDGATGNKMGLVSVTTTYGITTEPADNYKLKIVQSNADEIAGKTQRHKPITPNNLDVAVKVGLTTNTETLTDEEKAKAQEWLGIAGSGGVSQEDFDKLVNNEVQIKKPSNNGFASCGGRAVGFNSPISIGEGSQAQAESSIGIGYNANSAGNKAIQLGAGSNVKAKSLQIYDDNIYDAKNHTLTVQNIEQNGNNVYGIILAVVAPTETTEAYVGQFYFDISNKVLYQCVGIDSEVSAEGGLTENVYEWKVVGAGGGLSLINVNDTITTSDLKEVVNLTDEQYSELIANGSITIDGKTLTYNDNTIYVTPDVSKPNTLTFSGTNVLTSNETFNSHVHIMVEFETDSIHAGFDCVLHPYDEAVCFVTYNVLVNGSPNFGTAYLNENGQVVINVPSGLTFTNVHGKYVVYGG